jgi:VCBS repeat-containing protein
MNTRIGGTTAAAGNIIAHNGGLGGVRIVSGSSGNTIQRNSIYGNAGIGIDLNDDGITSNDGAKTGGAANLLMDSPVVGTANLVANNLSLTGYVGSAANQSTFANSRVEFFISDGSSANGSGQTFLGFLTTDANGNFTGTLDASGSGLTLTDSITATATDGSGNTSEFGVNFGVNVTPTAVADSNTAVEAGGLANGTAGTNPTGNVLTNDTDPDTGDTKTVTGVASGGSGSPSGSVGSNVSGSYGTLQIAANGVYVYTVDNSNATVQALRNSSDTLTDVFTYTMKDAGGLESSTQVTITIQGANDASLLAAIEGTALAYSENDGPVAITSTLALSDVDDTHIENALVKFTANYSSGQDLLAFTSQNGISGSWNSTTGELTLTGSATLAQYEAALRSITYENTSDNPSALTRTISFTINDGDANSNTLTRDIGFTSVNDAPVEATIEGTALAYTENDGPVAITSTLTISDLDDTNIESAVVQITGNYAGAQDVLAFTNQNGISGNLVGGTLTLTGSATLAQYEAALRSITYENTSDNPSALTRTISFTTNDGDANSNTLTRDIGFTSVNDAPVEATIEGTALAYTENDGPVAITSTLTISDLDDTNIESAVVQITGNYAGAQDVLAFTNQNGISGNLVGGTLTLTGSATLAQYEAALRSITYENTSDNPSALTRTISFTINDGDATSNTLTRDIGFTSVNDAPVEATIEGTALAYTENDGPVAITSTLTISDLDDTNIESAVVQITGNYAGAQDVLAFTNQNGISGNLVGGTLTLTGSATLAQYEAALRSITYENTSDNPSALTRTISFTINDGDANSNTLTRDIGFTAVNDAPVEATIEGTALAYTENDGPVAITSTLTISDLDDTNIESAVVQITGNYAGAQDVLAFTNQNGISGNLVGGTLTLTGSATLAQYEAALRSITYENTSDNPSALTRTISFTINDGDANSNTLTRDIGFTAVNDAPVEATIEGTALAYTENDGPVAITSTLTISDLDDTNIESAVVQITGNYAGAQDVLAFTNQNGISGNLVGGTLTLTGSATLAQYEAALRSITYENASDNPSALTRTISFTINDGDANSNTLTRDIGFTAVNDAPVEATIEGTALAYTENDGPVAITSTLTISDLDDTNIESAVVQITGNYAGAQDVLAFTNQNGISGNLVGGTLTLTGSATLAQYEAALRSITYENTSDNPSALTRTISFTINDGDANSNTLTRDIGFTAVNDAPVEATIEGTALAYTENDGAVAITSTLSISDLDDTNIESAVVQITGNYAGAQDVLAFTNQNGISGNLVGGTLTLAGSATLAQYQAALRSITYENTSDNPSALTRTISFTINDGDANSNTLTRDIGFTSVNDAPVEATIEGTALAYTENDGPVAITSTLTISDLDDTNIESAVVQITGNYAGAQDVLAFTNQNGISGNLVGGTLTLTGSATLAQYEAALRSITYENTSDNPSALTRTISFTINDGDANSNTLTRDIGFTSVNDAPVEATIEGTALAYTENDGPVAITSTLTISDLDDTNIESAVVQITGNYAGAQDVLAFTNQNGISGNLVGGTLTLTGSATLAQYQAALRSITYENTSDNPSALTRTISFTINDGDANSNTLTRDIGFTAVNDAPVEATIEGTALAYTENDGPVAITSTLTISDLDDTHIESAVVQITGNYAGAQDVLAFTNQNGISGNLVGGTLTLTGSATLAQYQAALRSITYENASDNPSALTRTISFTINDGDANSNTLTRDIGFTAVNDAPVEATIEGTALAYTENDGPVAITSTLTISDLDDTNIESAVVQITGNYAGAQDVLAFTNQNGISGNLVGGTLTLTGSATLAQYEAALRSITYENTSDNPSALTRTISFTINDGDANSNTLTRDIGFTAVNDAPVEATIEGTALAYTENDGPVAITSTLTISDLDDTHIESAVVQITGNYAGAQDVLAFHQSKWNQRQSSRWHVDSHWFGHAGPV